MFTQTVYKEFEIQRPRDTTSAAPEIPQHEERRLEFPKFRTRESENFAIPKSPSRARHCREKLRGEENPVPPEARKSGV